jgi:uncharacterized protein (TIGR00159 family)
MINLVFADSAVAIVDFTNPLVSVDFSLGIVLAIAIDLGLFYFLKRMVPRIYILVCELLYILAYVFEFSLIKDLLFAAFMVGITIFLFVNMMEYRHLVANGFKGKFVFKLFNKHPHSRGPEAIFDREAVYEKVYTAVLEMSRIKQGALITFQKKDNILDAKVGTIIKQRGVDVNAPVTPELLETIFYEGTRLHDGAVVIKDDKIARAAVFFTSTAQPLTGKYGSRHQAAIGISENSDSVTVVVSEETGRISIAFQGVLTSVNREDFLRVFEEDMAYESAGTPSKDENSDVNVGEGE